MTRYYPDLGSASDWLKIVWNFLARSSVRRRFAGKLSVSSSNVGCFLRLLLSNKAVVEVNAVFFFCLSSQRNGADFSVFVNTGQEFDGSDSGARPDEAVSWGKIKMTATPVKVEYTHNGAIDYY